MRGRIDYYAVLGVDAKADAAEIKRAYRLLAVKLHPDQNAGADSQQRFAELSEAYAVLADPARRSRYDGELIAARAAGPPEEALNDLFRGGAGGIKSAPLKGPLRSRCHVVIDGGADPAGELAYERVIACVQCNGRGGASARACEGCAGSGRMELRRGLRSTPFSCWNCRGRGIVAETRCAGCGGSGDARELVRVVIPNRAGDPAPLIRIPRGGDQPPGQVVGDLFIRAGSKRGP